jgi:M6 family metalloprotease-like protein
VNRRQAFVLLALLVSIPAAPAPPARAADTLSLDVRPVAPPEEILSQERRGVPVRADALTPAETAILKARLARQRDFHAFEKELHARAFKQGAGSSASRRPGWRPPLASAKNGFAPSALTQAPPVAQDTIRIALLRIDFLEDRGGTASSGTGRFNLDPADTLANPVDRPPHNRDFYLAHGEALQRYYDVQSYGRVRVEVDVWPAERDSAYHLSDMADLGPWRFGSSIFRAAVDMMRACFFAADSQSIAKGDRIPWAKYDRFDVVHAGSDLQSDIRGDSKEDIPSFTLFVDDTDRVIFPDSTNRDRPIDRCSFVPETINQDDAFGAINGVVAHENGHNMFGFGDVYNVETALPVVGYWSLMDSGNLVGAKVQTAQGIIFAVGLLAPSIDPFQRNFILDSGLLNYRQPTPDDTAAFTIQDGERNNDFVKIDLSSDEYLILENRYLSPAAAVHLLQDSLTRVVLGPRDPDRFEVDALLDGGGVLVWHIDESVIPFVTSLRVNPDFGFNTNPGRLGDQVIEADGLDDLGDTGSPWMLGSWTDPYQATVAPLLSETTIPNLIPNQGTHPHVNVDFLDDTSQNMHVRVTRSWQPQGWPVTANFPPGGPALLAIDVDGDGKRDVVWAGGDTTVTDTSLAAREAVRDSAAIFCVRFDGKGLNGADTLDFAHLDQRPRPEVAALVTGNAATGLGPAIVLATTYHYSASDTTGGKLWAVGPTGAPLPGFPVRLTSPASTPPVVVGDISSGWFVLVGCEDGRVRTVSSTGAVLTPSNNAVAGGVSGRLAYIYRPNGPGSDPHEGIVAYGGRNGEVAMVGFPSLVGGAGSLVSLGRTGFAPDFLWAYLGGSGANEANDCRDPVSTGGPLAWPTLLVHDADRVWALCPNSGAQIPGWGAPLGDTLVAGLAAGDVDGDGFPEVIVQTIHSRLMFLNSQTGKPSPGWPRAASPDEFRTSSAPLAVDLTNDGRPEMVALTASGEIVALDRAGHAPDGWPLATGSGCAGSILATDLEGDGVLDIVAPDRFGRLYAYSVGSQSSGTASPWTMLGGDPARTSSLPGSATSSPTAPTPGPLIAGSLKAYPNPARQKPVQFAYQLSEDATVEFRILDSSGHEVASWSRAGKRSDNLEVWNPQGLPAGLYVAHIRFSGAGGARTENLPLGIVR